MRIIASLILALCFVLPSAAPASAYDIDALATQAQKAVPSGSKLMNKQDEDDEAQVLYMLGGQTWQFYLNDDTDQDDNTEALKVKGYTARTYTTPVPGMRGAYVYLVPGKLCLRVISIVRSGKTITPAAMTALIEKMDLSALK